MSVLDYLDPTDRKPARRAKQPSWLTPMKAVLVDEAFSDPDWIYDNPLATSSESDKVVSVRQPRPTAR